MRRSERRLRWTLLCAALAPLVVLAALVTLAERLLGDDGTVGKLLARPFLWAVERRRSA